MYNIKTYIGYLRMYRNHNRNKKGVTLIEALFVLGIMAVILGLTFVVYSEAQDKRKTTELKEEIGLLKYTMDSMIQDQVQGQNGKETINGQLGYYGLGADELIKSGMIPNKYINGKYIVTPFGGKIDFHVDYNSVWVLWIYGLSKNSCVTIATTEWGNIHNMNINNKGDYGGTWPVQGAVSSCNYSDNNNYIGMSFTRD